MDEPNRPDARGATQLEVDRGLVALVAVRPQQGAGGLQIRLGLEPQQQRKDERQVRALEGLVAGRT
jgi:hypothetical protein